MSSGVGNVDCLVSLLVGLAVLVRGSTESVVVRESDDGRARAWLGGTVCELKGSMREHRGPCFYDGSVGGASAESGRGRFTIAQIVSSWS